MLVYDFAPSCLFFKSFNKSFQLPNALSQIPNPPKDFGRSPHPPPMESFLASLANKRVVLAGCGGGSDVLGSSVIYAQIKDTAKQAGVSLRWLELAALGGWFLPRGFRT